MNAAAALAITGAILCIPLIALWWIIGYWFSKSSRSYRMDDKAVRQWKYPLAFTLLSLASAAVLATWIAAVWATVS